jgi:hypothetical protein
MAKKNKNSLRLDADFTEDTVGFAIETFLSVLSFPRLKFSVEPFSRGRERWLGADARLNGHLKGFKPFYMQFKRPSAYPDSSGSSIIKNRSALHLPVSPRTLYFGLREKQKNHGDFQHNILYRLRRKLIARGIGDATYVCPLFLDRSAYRFHIHMAGLKRWPKLWRHDPWELEDILISSLGGALNFAGIPVLAEHVSIPPHALVKNAKHSYSFTEQGTDLCFHSPRALPEGTTNLAEFLTKVTGDLRDENAFIAVDAAQQQLREIFSGSDNDGESLLPPDEGRTDGNGIGAWLQWGEYLRQEFQVEQFAIAQWEV